MSGVITHCNIDSFIQFIVINHTKVNSVYLLSDQNTQWDLNPTTLCGLLFSQSGLTTYLCYFYALNQSCFGFYISIDKVGEFIDCRSTQEIIKYSIEDHSGLSLVKQQLIKTHLKGLPILKLKLKCSFRETPLVFVILSLTML